jgi:signal transduction histidine kinase
MKALSSLKNRVFLASAFGAVVSIAVGTQFVTTRVSREAEAALRRDLQQAADVLEAVQQQRQETLAVLAGLVADLPKLKAAVATRDGPTVDPLARDYQKSLGVDVLVITDEEGRVLTSIGSAEEVVTADAVRRAREGKSSSYLGETSKGVLRVATLPIVIGPAPPEVLGTLSVGYFVDRTLAHELAALTQSDVVLVARGRPVAWTLSLTPEEIQTLASSLEDSVRVGDDDYVTVRRTLSVPETKDGVLAILVRSRTERLAFLRTFRAGLLISALFGILLATVLAYAVARTVTRPLAAITATMREITTTGDLARKIDLPGPLVDEDATVLASAFNRLTESIARFQREAASRERLSALGRMSTVIAHEIRNPLMIIKASLRGLRREELSPEEVAEAADDIDHEVDRLNRIVGDVLDFARPIKVELHPTDVNGVCRSAVAAVAVEKCGTSIEMRLDEGLPELSTDGERLRTALVNVIANARDAVASMGANGNGDSPAIELETLRVDGGGVTIFVRDRGIGIAPDDLPRIFEPYYTGKRTGTGLGLAITKNIVESLGGTVSARSRPSEGAEIRIELFPSRRET